MKFLKNLKRKQKQKKLLDKYNIKLAENVQIDICSINFFSKNQYFEVGERSVIQSQIILQNQSAKIKIGEKTFIGKSQLFCVNEIEIGSSVLIAPGCIIIDHDSHSLNYKEREDDVYDCWLDLKEQGYQKNIDIVKQGKVTIADNAWIGMNAIILKGVSIGKGAIIAAGSVVAKDVMPFTLVGGNPAKEIRKLEE